VRDLAVRVHEPEDRVREVLRKQVTQGGVYQWCAICSNDRERIAELAEIVGAATREQGGVNAARFRDTLGLGASAPSRSWSSLIAWVTPGAWRDAHVLRPDSAWRSSSTSARG